LFPLILYFDELRRIKKIAKDNKVGGGGGKRKGGGVVVVISFEDVGGGGGVRLEESFAVN
jgi:hypothetical protein